MKKCKLNAKNSRKNSFTYSLQSLEYKGYLKNLLILLLEVNLRKDFVYQYL